MEISMPEGRRRRGRPRQFDRDEAVATALTLFQQRGYEGTSIADLTAAIGISATSLYGVFASKEALFEETVDLYQRRDGAFAEAALDRPGSVEEAVHALLMEAAQHYSTGSGPRGCFISLGVLCCAVEHRAVADRMAARRLAARDRIKIRLDQGKQAGELTDSADTQALAAFYAATLQGLSIQARDGATEHALRQIADLALAPLRSVLVSTR